MTSTAAQATSTPLSLHEGLLKLKNPSTSPTALSSQAIANWEAKEVSRLLSEENQFDFTSARPAYEQNGAFCPFSGTESSGFSLYAAQSAMTSEPRKNHLVTNASSRYNCLTCEDGVPHQQSATSTTSTTSTQVPQYLDRNAPIWTSTGSRGNFSTPGWYSGTPLLRSNGNSSSQFGQGSSKANPHGNQGSFENGGRSGASYGGSWVTPIQDSSRRPSHSNTGQELQGRSCGTNRSPLEPALNVPEVLHVNPYADYGRQLVHGGREFTHPGGAFSPIGSREGYGIQSQVQAAPRQISRPCGNSNIQLQQERNFQLNSLRATQPGRAGHNNPSGVFGGNSLPKQPPSERMLIPRKELEMLSRFGETGGAPGQLDSPHGFCLGSQGEIIVADTMNNRIQIFDQKGSLLLSWGTSGYRKGRLWQPRKVAYLHHSDRVVVSDRGRDCSRLQIFSRNGDFFSQIRQIRATLFVGLTVYRGLIIAIENQPSSCVVITQEGKLLYQFTLDHVMQEPSDVLVVSETFYICDFLGHCVCVFSSTGSLLQRIGSAFPGIIFFPNGIDVAESGDVIVADTHGNRFHVSVWSPQGKLLADYELPHMKVSRCCGLFMTPEGNLITAATNNNIVLITNLLRVPSSPSPPALPESSLWRADSFTQCGPYAYSVV